MGKSYGKVRTIKGCLDNLKWEYRETERGFKNIKCDCGAEVHFEDKCALEYIMCDSCKRGIQDIRGALSAGDSIILIREGKYRHFKGGIYNLIGSGKHSETNEYLAIYRREDDENSIIQVRPLHMFFEEIPKGEENPTGQKYRFEYINNE